MIDIGIAFSYKELYARKNNVQYISQLDINYGHAYIFYGILTAPVAIAQIFIILRRRADIFRAVIAKTIIVLIQAAGRFLLLPACEGILFYRDGD